MRSRAHFRGIHVGTISSVSSLFFSGESCPWVVSFVGCFHFFQNSYGHFSQRLPSAQPPVASSPSIFFQLLPICSEEGSPNLSSTLKGNPLSPVGPLPAECRPAGCRPAERELRERRRVSTVLLSSQPAGWKTKDWEQQESPEYGVQREGDLDKLQRL